MGKKQKGARKEKEKNNEMEGERERGGKEESFQRAAGKPPESSAQTNHKIPAEATKPGRGLTRVPPARRGCVCSQDCGVCARIFSCESRCVCQM